MLIVAWHSGQSIFFNSDFLARSFTMHPVINSIGNIKTPAINADKTYIENIMHPLLPRKTGTLFAFYCIHKS